MTGISFEDADGNSCSSLFGGKNSMEENNYCVLIGDIIKSRKYSNRNEIQKKLNAILSETNKKYSEDIAAEFIITLGDEFQGVLNKPDRIFQIVDNIRFSMRPVKIRVGIGIGKITTEIDRSKAISADGPAYYAAREMIDDIRKKEKGWKSLSQDIKISLGTDNLEIDLINANLGLTSLLESSWTKKQFEAVRLLLYSDSLQKEAAQKIGITESSMHYRLKSAHYFDYKHSRELISKYLIHLWKEKCSPN
jgi:hypothetical protein